MKISNNPFITEFEIELSKTNNEHYLIQNELTQIALYISKPINNDLNNFIDIVGQETHVFDLSNVGLSKNNFINYFNQLMKNGNINVLENMDSFDEELIEKSKFFIDYYNWLVELQKSNSKNTIAKKPSLTHKQKMIALHYLGLDFSNYDNVKLAKVLSEILELNEENTRKYLSYLSGGKNEVRTKNNLETVAKLFEDKGLLDISTIIEDDLKK